MSWQQWSNAPMPQSSILPPTIINPAPNVVNPASSQYTPEQWAQMQQQNWQQWAQWQQQFQQWQQQYGAEYQKSMALMQASQTPTQPALSLFNTSAPPPLPAETKPPLPPPDDAQLENSPAHNTSSSLSSGHPLPMPVQPPAPSPIQPPIQPLIQPLMQSSIQPLMQSSVQPPLPDESFQNSYNHPKSNTGSGYKSHNVNDNKQRFGGNNQNNSNKPGFNQNWQNRNQQPFNNQPASGSFNESRNREYGVKRAFNQSHDISDTKRNKIETNAETNHWQGSQQQRLKWGNAPMQQGENLQWNTKPPENLPKRNPEELTEQEKKFDKQFAEWESQFQKWKEQNANHPDKEQYREYEKKWETWRLQLLERREQMKRKRLGMAADLPQSTKTDITQQKPTEQPTSISDPMSNRSGSEFKFQPSSASIGIKSNQVSTGLSPVSNTSVQNKLPELNKPCFHVADEQENKSTDQGVGESFLKSLSTDGIPGLDLVEDEEEEKVESGDQDLKGIKDLEKRPDLEAISRGINSILGDQKLLNILSMVSQNQSVVSNTVSTVLSMKGSFESDRVQNLNIENPENNQTEILSNIDEQTRSSFHFSNALDIQQSTNNMEGDQNMDSFDQNSGNWNKDTEKNRNFASFGNFNKDFAGERNTNNFRGPFDNRNRNTFGDNFNNDLNNSNRRGDNFNKGLTFNRGFDDGNNRGRGDNSQRNFERGLGSDNFNKNMDDPNFDHSNMQSDQTFNKGVDNYNKPFDNHSDNFKRGYDNFSRGVDNFNRGFDNFNRGFDNFNRDSNNLNRGLDNLNRGFDNTNCGSDDFNRGPNLFNRGFNNSNRDSDNLDKGPGNFNTTSENFNRGPNNFNRGSDNFNRPNNFNRGSDNINRGPNNSNRGGLDNFNKGPGNFNRGPGNFNRGADNLNKGPDNFNKGFDNFNKGPDNFNKGFDNFNRGFDNSNRGFNNFNRDGNNSNKNFDNVARGPGNFNRGPDNFNRGKDNINSFDNMNNFNMRSDNYNRNLDHFNPAMRNINQSFEDDGLERNTANINQNLDEMPNVLTSNLNERSNSSVDKISDNLLGNKNDFANDRPTADLNKEIDAEENLKTVDDTWKPSTVIDYDHKTLKPAEPDVLVEPTYIFDYRHKPLNRIPYPERPSWLANMVRNYPEFDLRPIEQQLRKYPNERYESREYSKYNERNRRYDDRERMPVDDYIRKENIKDDYSSKRINDDYDKKLYERDYHSSGETVSKKQDNKMDVRKKDVRDQRLSDKTDSKRHSNKESEKYGSSKDNKDHSFANERDRNKEEMRVNKDESKDNANVTTISSSKTNVTLIEDLLSSPGRYNRPHRLVIILRGPPGSGKSFLAKLIKDKEVENGGSPPRILCLDDYFMVEQEKEIEEDGRKVKVKEMLYEYEEGMEASYRLSLVRSFKKTITDGYFNFIIVDNINDKVKYFGEMWSFAKQNGFQVYICQMDLDVQTCTKRNIHGRSEQEIEKCVAAWEPTPNHHPVLDATSLIQSGSIPEVEMEEINSPSSENLDEEAHLISSKWDTIDYSVDTLAKLDGTNKPLRASKTMEDYLQLDDEWVQQSSKKPGQKRVRWADLEERKQQEKMRAIGFVVGQTNWDRMMDPTMGSSALTQTKYIERYN